MNTWIALFRGINVGGKNILKMAELKESLAALKFKNVKTYIQSGNVVFESSSKSSAALSKKISKMVEAEYGFAPHVMVISGDQLKDAIKNNPFPNAVNEPKSLHLFFLAKACNKPDLEGIKAAKKASEHFKLTQSVFYLHAPDGFHGSKLAPKAEKLLGVAATARNYRTVEKLMEMVDC